MQQWRTAHPGYWRRRARIGRYLVDGKLAEVMREFASRDEIDAPFSLVIGLVSHLTQSASRDEIASEIRRLILVGHGVLHQPTIGKNLRRQPD